MIKTTLHSRNRHQGRYDFELLVKTHPALKPFVSPKAHGGEPSIDFSNPEAVKTLNQALLKQFYGVSKWEIPQGYLCPPIPGRADYVHHIADILSTCNEGIIPRGARIRVLDIGVGANCIYPIIGRCEYGWSFVGTDIDPEAIASAQRIVGANPEISEGIEIKLQSAPSNILKGLIQPQDRFDLSISNPPFHASLEEAQEGSLRKWKNLGVKSNSGKGSPLLNFGGRSSELWCPGGESAFVRRMIEESVDFSKNFLWFTTLLSKESNLPRVEGALRKSGVENSRTILMSQGQKKSRIVAWTFLSQNQQEEWREERWG